MLLIFLATLQLLKPLFQDFVAPAVASVSYLALLLPVVVALAVAVAVADVAPEISVVAGIAPVASADSVAA